MKGNRLSRLDLDQSSEYEIWNVTSINMLKIAYYREEKGVYLNRK